MGAQIPAIAEKPLATCGCRKFQLDPLVDHLNTCTAHSGAKKTHDWMVDQVADFFRKTHKPGAIGDGPPDSSRQNASGVQLAQTNPGVPVPRPTQCERGA